jgi:hypothetical protein
MGIKGIRAVRMKRGRERVKKWEGVRKYLQVVHLVIQ